MAIRQQPGFTAAMRGNNLFEKLYRMQVQLFKWYWQIGDSSMNLREQCRNKHDNEI